MLISRLVISGSGGVHRLKFPRVSQFALHSFVQLCENTIFPLFSLPGACEEQLRNYLFLVILMLAFFLLNKLLHDSESMVGGVTKHYSTWKKTKHTGAQTALRRS
jgi:hypothetical protein